MAAADSHMDVDYAVDIEAKPFSRDFRDQKESAENLFGRQLRIRIESISSVMPVNSGYDEYIISKDVVRRCYGRFL